MSFIWMYQPDGSRNLNGRVPRLWRDAGIRGAVEENLYFFCEGLREILSGRATAEREKELDDQALLLNQHGFPPGLNMPLFTKYFTASARDWQANVKAGRNSWREGATEEFLKNYEARRKRLVEAARPENRPRGVYLFKTSEDDDAGADTGSGVPRQRLRGTRHDQNPEE
jgi:hypothetical protein